MNNTERSALRYVAYAATLTGVLGLAYAVGTGQYQMAGGALVIVVIFGAMTVWAVHDALEYRDELAAAGPTLNALSDPASEQPRPSYSNLPPKRPVGATVGGTPGGWQPTKGTPFPTEPPYDDDDER